MLFYAQRGNAPCSPVIYVRNGLSIGSFAYEQPPAGHSSESDMKNIKVGIIGNMLGRNGGYVTTQGQILADLLLSEGVPVVSSSAKVNRTSRLIDIVTMMVRNRGRMD